jgi:hypothetical protein
MITSMKGSASAEKQTTRIAIGQEKLPTTKSTTTRPTTIASRRDKLNGSWSISISILLQGDRDAGELQRLRVGGVYSRDGTPLKTPRDGGPGSSL